MLENCDALLNATAVYHEKTIITQPEMLWARFRKFQILALESTSTWPQRLTTNCKHKRFAVHTERACYSVTPTQPKGC